MLTANEAWMRFSSAYNSLSNMLGQQIISIIVFTIHYTLDNIPVQILQIKITIKPLEDTIDIKKNKDIII